MKAVEPYDLFFFEEPMHYTDPWGYAELARGTSVPIAGGECLTAAFEWRVFGACRDPDRFGRCGFPVVERDGGRQFQSALAARKTAGADLQQVGPRGNGRFHSVPS